jgi:hypothetical protein
MGSSSSCSFLMGNHALPSVSYNPQVITLHNGQGWSLPYTFWFLSDPKKLKSWPVLVKIICKPKNSVLTISTNGLLILLVWIVATSSGFPKSFRNRITGAFLRPSHDLSILVAKFSDCFEYYCQIQIAVTTAMHCLSPEPLQVLRLLT